MDPYHDQSVSVYRMGLPEDLDPTQPVTVQILVPAPERSPDEAPE